MSMANEQMKPMGFERVLLCSVTQLAEGKPLLVGMYYYVCVSVTTFCFEYETRSEDHPERKSSRTEENDGPTTSRNGWE